MELPQESVRNLRIQNIKESNEVLDIIGVDNVKSALEAVLGVKRATERAYKSEAMFDKTSDDLLRTQR